MTATFNPVSFNNLLLRTSRDVSMTSHLLDYCRLPTCLHSIDPQNEFQRFSFFKFAAEPDFWTSCSSVLRSPWGQRSSREPTIPESTVDNLALSIDIERSHLLHRRQLRSVVFHLIYYILWDLLFLRICYRGVGVARGVIKYFFGKIILKVIVYVLRSRKDSFSERPRRRWSSMSGRQHSWRIFGTENNNSCENFVFFTNFAKINLLVPLFVL